MASGLECSSSFRDSDELMIDPFLDFLNEILMEEESMDDATQLQQAGNTSDYEAIFRSLQDIIGEPATDDQLHIGVSVSANDHPQSNRVQESLPIKSTDVMDLQRSHVYLNSDTTARNHSNAILMETMDGALPRDAMVSCWAKDHPRVECLSGRTGQGHGRAISKLPSAHDQTSSNVAELESSFRDLKLDDVYTSLYLNKSSSSMDIAAGCYRIKEDKKRSMAAGNRVIRNTNTSKFLVSGVVNEALMSCAQAVANGNVIEANQVLEELRRVYGASAHGTGVQRMAYIFSRALAARMKGTGAQEFEAMSCDMPSPATILRASKLKFEVSPNQKIVHYFANQSILQASEGASSLHIVDFGIMLGLQWPCLINALADRKGGPPLMVITGIEFPQPGIDMAKRLDESGHRLAAYAKSHNVPFQYHALVTDKWEDLDAASLFCSEAEVLVINCIKPLRYFADDTTPSPPAFSPYQKLFTMWRNLNPHLVITAVLNASLNSPFFLSRFREALYFYTSVFDAADILWGNILDKIIFERSFHYRQIINIVACEGTERIERPESYKQWHAYITKAGFEQLPVPFTILARSKSHVKQHYHKDYLIAGDDKGWIVMGWKGRVLIAVSAWKPC